MDKPVTSKSKLIVVGVLVVAIGLLAFFLAPRPTVYRTDTALDGDHAIPKGERVVLADGAALHIKGDLALDGTLECDDGPLMLTVDGALRVSGTLRCDRDAEIGADDIGSGIAVVALGGVEFTSDATVASNGHVQLVDSPEKIVSDRSGIDRIFDDAGEDQGDGLRVGPFVPIEPEGTGDAGRLIYPTGISAALSSGGRGPLSGLLVPAAHAAGVERAEEIGGMPVPDTVKIGGTWVMGHGQAAPRGIAVPTPPKGVKRIVLYYDFSFGKTVLLNDLTIFGPEGRPGDDDSGASCNARGKDGEDAFRFNALVKDIVINDFTIYLGDGGAGGEAVTKEDCDHGQATGGDGGEPGNMKMRSTGSFRIAGSMKVVPGMGGPGGDARAFGKKGDNGCPGKAGGDATARGGKGGDNKKGLKVVNVEGVENIELDDLLGGMGGDATAFGGDGGEGTGPKCDGGDGGDATAFGGDGGDTTSRTVDSYGGPGGDADPYPGVGGDGGKGSAKEPGGNGGNGGDGDGAPGTGGSGRTETGADGTWSNEDGGPGGNGGDGCGPGKGGDGGSHINPGADGIDGKDLCEGAPPKTAFRLGTDVLRKTHTIGRSPCPDPFDGGVSVEGPEGGRWEIDTGTVPRSLRPGETGGSFGSGASFFDVFFTCNIGDFSSHTEEGRIRVRGFGADGEPLGESFFDVYIDVVAR